MRRVFVCLLLLCVVALPARADALKVGILPVLDTLPLQVAVRDGLFKSHGLDVELVPFASALERDTAMQTGLLDGYFGDLVATLLLAGKGVPIKIVTESWRTAPGRRMFALLLAQGKEPEQRLKTGISRSTVMEYLLGAMQARHPVSELDVEVLEVKKIPIRLQMLLSGQIDMALLPEPLVTLSESKGATVVATDEELYMPLTVLCLHERVAENAQAFVAAYAEAVQRINTHPGDYRELMVSTCRIPAPLAPSFPVYKYPAPRLPSENDVWKVQQWMLTRGMLDKMIDYSGLVAK